MSKAMRTAPTPALVLDARLSRRRLWAGLVLSPLLIGLMGLLFVAVLVTFVIELRTRTARLHIDRTSIHDRRLTRDAITWGEVRALLD